MGLHTTIFILRPPGMIIGLSRRELGLMGERIGLGRAAVPTG